MRQRGCRASIVVLPAQIWYLRAVEVKEETFRVRTFDCQADGGVSVFSLMQHLQEIAAGHAEELGFGFARMGEMDAYWVLSNIRIEIDRLPRRDEEVTIRTWPSGYTRTVAMREFIGMDRNGGEMFRAGSEWMVLNKKTNRLKNLFVMVMMLNQIPLHQKNPKLERFPQRLHHHLLGRPGEKAGRISFPTWIGSNLLAPSFSPG